MSESGSGQAGGRSESASGQAGGRSESASGQAGGRSESGGGEAELLRSEIDRNLLGGEARYDRTQVAEAVGIDLARAQQLWIAMGFPVNTDENAVMFTDADVEALRLITGLVEANIVEQSMEVAIARTLGQSMSRLAEWQVGVVNDYIVKGLEQQTSDDEDVRRDARDLASNMVPTIEHLQNYVWRRHLAAVAVRARANNSDGEPSTVTCVGFADMVGYTSLTRRLGVDELTALLEEFESVTTDTIARGHGSVVKNVGDEVMFQASSPADAARIALTLHEAFADREDVPDLRVGIAFGPVLARFGDLYGSVVNIAARLTSAAHPGTVLVDSEMADALAEDDSFRLKSVRPFRVRGYRKLRPYSLRRQKIHAKDDDGDVMSISEKSRNDR